jgi:hypothetical protein
MAATDRDPKFSLLYNQDDRSVLVKILAEMRVQTFLMAQGFGITDDISALRDEVMAQGNRTTSDV